MSQFTNKENIESYLGRDLTDGEAALVTNLIEHISNFIKTFTNRNWLDVSEDEGDEPEVSTKVYDGNGYKELFTDDFTDLDEIRILDSNGDVYLTLDDSSEWVLYPHNETTKESIYLRNYTFPTTVSGVEIDAVFTSGVVPAGVVVIASMLCGRFFTSAVSGGLESESIEGYSYKILDPQQSDMEIKLALETLGGLRKLQI